MANYMERTNGYMEKMGMEPDEFWNKCAEFSKKNNVDNILTYMYLMIQVPWFAVIIAQ